MCHIELGSLAEWVGGLAAVATAIIACIALFAWRDQMRGTSRHLAAAEILEAARLMKYHFCDARNPFYSASEYPVGYHQNSNRTSHDEADAWAHIFTKRWELLQPQIIRLANLRAKAGALLGEGSATALEELAKKGRELHNFFQEKVSHERAGPNIVKQWPDQNWVKRVESSVKVNLDDHTDSYSLEFEKKFEALRKLIEPHI